jgi:hypothetical protein
MAADSSQHPDVTDVTKSEEILSKPANKSTPARMRVFLDTYAKTGRVNRACEVAHITPRTHYRKLEDAPVYRQAFGRAEYQVGQMLEGCGRKTGAGRGQSPAAGAIEAVSAGCLPRACVGRGVGHNQSGGPDDGRGRARTPDEAL